MALSRDRFSDNSYTIIFLLKIVEGWLEMNQAISKSMFNAVGFNPVRK